MSEGIGEVVVSGCSQWYCVVLDAVEPLSRLAESWVQCRISLHSPQCATIQAVLGISAKKRLGSQQREMHSTILTGVEIDTALYIQRLMSFLTICA